MRSMRSVCFGFISRSHGSVTVHTAAVMVLCYIQVHALLFSIKLEKIHLELQTLT
jgi:hypothetical protein